MMVQTAPEGQPHFVSTMIEHMELCGQMARAFGNDRFEALNPEQLVLYVVENHDRGWDAYDTNPGLDPRTRLPYLMAQTPVPDAIKTNVGSPNHNESYHPYCGLLSSMHTWGLYNRRYGFSQFVVRAQNSLSIPILDSHRAQLQAMLAAELDRQRHLKTVLAGSPGTRSLSEEAQILQNYKQLQFFDTLSLYFHLYHAEERGEEVYIHVPMNVHEDTNVTVCKLDETTYSLDPFPFGANSLSLVCRGRYVLPYTPGHEPANLGAALRSLPQDVQTFKLVPRR
jgi:hypothetical protein